MSGAVTFMRAQWPYPSTYLVPSIGRCGSNLLTRLIAASSGLPIVFARSYDQLVTSNAVVKTHLKYRDSISGDFRAVFVYDDPCSIVASLYDIWGDKTFGDKWNDEKGVSRAEALPSDFYRHWFKRHLTNLSVAESHLDRFFYLSQRSKLIGFMYLVAGDKLGFIANVASWNQAVNTVMLRFSSWHQNYEAVTQVISQHLGLDLAPKPTEIKQRRSSKDTLPLLLRMAIRVNYPRAFAPSGLSPKANWY